MGMGVVHQAAAKTPALMGFIGGYRIEVGDFLVLPGAIEPIKDGYGFFFFKDAAAAVKRKTQGEEIV